MISNQMADQKMVSLLNAMTVELSGSAPMKDTFECISNKDSDVRSVTALRI